MPLTVLIAFDTTARSKDADGRLHISRTHISKATVNPYFGSEIPRSEELGLIPDKIYNLLRDPEELARGAQTFARLPILKKHVVVSADDIKPEYIAGSIGSNVEFTDPYLDADVCIWDAESIAGIETNTVREFSCSYRYRADMTPGEYQGQPYDGVMREIIGNHLALVEAGRAGSDVLAADGDITMKMTKLGRALFLTLGGMSPKLAADSTLAGLVAKASKKTPVKADELAPKLVAMDSELDPEKVKKTLAAVLALDAEKPAEDSEEDEEEVEGADDEETDEEKEKAAKDKRAKDEEKSEKAMDAKIAAATEALRREFAEADEAKRLVRPVVGDVIAQDSAEQIYAFALDHLKVPHDGVTGTPALRALFNVASKSQSSTPAVPPVAMDSKLVEMFPDATRFGRR